jgi:hypothetical protein
MKLSTITTITLAAAVAASLAACGDDETTTNPTTTTTTTGGGGPGGGGDGGGGNNQGGGGSSQGGGGSAPATCADYCTANLEICMDANAQYAGMAQQFCEGICETWDQGAPGATTGDNLECRFYHTNAGPMLNDVATHCPHGGPYGSGQCGMSNCDTFCAAIVELCTGNNEQYADVAECMTDCTALPDATDAYVVDAAATGANFACRGYHLTAASVDPDTHCAHAGGQMLCN